jgi:hypothetical protein
VYLPATGEIGLRNATAAFTYRYADGDIVATDAFATQVASKEIHLGAYGKPSFLVACGDSIYEGHNTNNQWHSLYDIANGGVSGTPTSELWNQMRAIMAGLEYQNYSYGSQTMSWVNTTGFTQAFTTYALKSKVWLIGAGVNDINTGRAWADVEIDLDAIRARCTTGEWLTEILPIPISDAHALIRTSRQLCIWCAANNAH